MANLEQYCRFVEVQKNVFRLDKDSRFFAEPQIVNPLDGDTRINEVYDGASGLYQIVNSRHHLEEDFFEPICKVQNSYTTHNIFCGSIGNAEIHGNKFNPKKQTVVSYLLKKTRKAAILELSVRDEGDGFDYIHVQKAEQESRETERSYNSFRKEVPEHSVGHGLFGIIRYCDVVRWNPKGNEITMLKVLIRK